MSSADNQPQDTPVETSKPEANSSSSSLSENLEQPLCDPSDFKIFVGGLSSETTEDDLLEYFKQFGEPKKCTIKYNNDSKVSRGFGFVTFADEAATQAVLAADEHHIDGKKIDCKTAMTKEEALEKHQAEIDQQRKIYVRSIPPNQKKSQLREFFSQYGKVQDVNLIYKSSESKGFAFIVFSSSQEAQKVLDLDEIIFDNAKLSAKLAIPKKQIENEKTSQYFQAGSMPFYPPQKRRHSQGFYSLHPDEEYQEGGHFMPPNRRTHSGIFSGGQIPDEHFSHLAQHPGGYYPPNMGTPSGQTSLADIASAKTFPRNRYPQGAPPPRREGFVECPGCQLVFQIPHVYSYHNPGSMQTARMQHFSYEDAARAREESFNGQPGGPYYRGMGGPPPHFNSLKTQKHFRNQQYYSGHPGPAPKTYSKKKQAPRGHKAGRHAGGNKRSTPKTEKFKKYHNNNTPTIKEDSKSGSRGEKGSSAGGVQAGQPDLPAQ